MFSLHGLAFAWVFLPVDQFNGKSTAGVFAAYALLMFLQAFIKIYGIAGIIGLVAALQNIYKRHYFSFLPAELLAQKNKPAGDSSPASLVMFYLKR